MKRQTGVFSAKTITALKSYDSKAVTYMIRGKMMSLLICCVATTYLQVYFSISCRKSKENK